MGLYCNGADDSAKKLQLDFASPRQRLFKRLGFKDRNNNGIIEAKENNPLNRLIKADEGYGSILTPHSADTNKDRKIDEKEAWNFYYRNHLKPKQNDIFLTTELERLNSFVDKKKFLDKAANKHLKPYSKEGLGRFLASVLQIGINKNNKELVRYSVNYLIGCSIKHKGIYSLCRTVGKNLKNLNSKRLEQILENIIENSYFNNQYSRLKVIAGILGKKHSKKILNNYLKHLNDHGISAWVLLLLGAYSNKQEKQKLISIVGRGLYSERLQGALEENKILRTEILKTALKSKYLRARTFAAKLLLEYKIYSGKKERRVLEGYYFIGIGELGKLFELEKEAIPALKATPTAKGAENWYLHVFYNPKPISVYIKDLFAKNSNKKKYRAAIALGILKNPKAIPSLRKALEETPACHNPSPRGCMDGGRGSYGLQTGDIWKALHWALENIKKANKSKGK